MKSPTIHFFKLALRAGTFVAAITVGSHVMLADTINFTGSASGAFQNGAPSNLTTWNALTYRGSTFDGTTTSSGYLAFGGVDGAGINVNNFGSFEVASSDASYNNDPFTLYITFTSPGGIDSGQDTTFDATIFGMVTSNDQGGATVTFSPNSKAYTFANATQTGSFTLNLNNVSINPNQTATVTGYITSQATSNAVTPEPSSLMLLGTGLLGTAGMAFRRRKLVTGNAVGA